VTILATLRGSICIYQGEELGLPEADIAFEDLQDPYGIRFWPSFKGRDGCRTPMPWDKALPNAGFTTAAKPWLPVPQEHAALAVDTQDGVHASVLEHYRQILAFRRSHAALLDGEIDFLEADGDILAYVREKGDERMLFIFNLSRQAVDFALPEGMAAKMPVALPGYGATLTEGTVSLKALDACCALLG
jgi:alpha-glucosidase